jgi:hypothetical protein
MIQKQPIAWAIAALLGMTATAAQAAEDSCITSAQFADVVLVATPNILATVRDKCGAGLASDSPLRDPASAWATRYQAAAKEAWPRAKDAMINMRGADMTAADKKKLSEMLSPALVDAILAPIIDKAVTPQSCPTIDHVTTLLAPLPPANFGQLVSLVAELGLKNRQAQPAGGLRICKH